MEEKMEEIGAIDIMCYPVYFNQALRQPPSEDFRIMALTTFKTRTAKQAAGQPVPVQEPASSVEEVVAGMDRIGHDKICINATKMWSYHYHHKLIWDYKIEDVYDIVQKGKGRIIGGAGYNPFRIEESIKEIDKAVNEYGFKFVYVHTLGFGLSPRDKKLYPLYAKCNELGIAVSMQIGHSAEPLPSWVGHPMEIDEVALDFPNLKINLSHTGWPWIDEWCDMLWKHPNVYGDISAYNPSNLEPQTIRFMNGGRGRDKVMWGSNGSDHEGKIKQIMAMDLKDESRRMILRENAIRFLNL